MKIQFDANTPENIEKGERAELLSFLQDGKVDFYGYRERSVPNILQGKPASQVRIFQRRAPDKPAGDFPPSSYKELMDISVTEADACFLDREALMVLLAGFPTKPGCVLARFTFRLSWLLALPGLLRRILIKEVQLFGILTLESEGTRQRWLVIRQRGTTLYRNPSLSSKVGIPGFLEYLRKERIRYVVLRFYQSLPSLHREWGDLDILASDEDESRITEFLAENPGHIRLDIWTVSKRYGPITYYPPPLARQILENTEEGPAGARIPAPREAFLSFAYHAIYHKGPYSGVPSNLPEVHVNPKPENDYKGMLAKMAEELGISVNITMEDLDEYLHQQGWRPKLDTLSKIAPGNEWVSYRFFTREKVKEIGLGVFILKRKAFSLGLVDSLLNMIKKEGFFILRKKEFNEEEKYFIADNLRGGDWSGDGEELEELLPAMAVTVLDAYSGHGGNKGRIAGLKASLRQSFDSGEASVVHSTDTTLEAWEYIEVCFKEETEALEEEILRMLNSKLSLQGRLNFYRKLLGYYYRKAPDYFRYGLKYSLYFFVRRFLQA